MGFELRLPDHRALSTHEETVLGFSGAGGTGGGPWKLSPGAPVKGEDKRSETRSVQKEGVGGRGEILQRDTHSLALLFSVGEGPGGMGPESKGGDLCDRVNGADSRVGKLS